MPKAKNSLKWLGAEALAACSLCQFKLPGKIGGAPVFYQGRSEITPFFMFTPCLKWGTVNTAGLLGLSFRGVDDFVDTSGKNGSWPSLMIHTANFPGDLARYINAEEAENGMFKVWAVLVERCLSKYPTSVEEMVVQLKEGRLGGFRADQQFRAGPPDKVLANWLEARGISVPPGAPLPIQAVANAPTSLH